MADTGEFEKAYRERLAQGQERWHPGAFEDFDMRCFVECQIKRIPWDPAGRRVLDLGCGTGQIACFFAARGASVTGIEISPSALQKAKDIAIHAGFSIDYQMGDFLSIEMNPSQFDLVIDCQFLHCIVDWQDRAAVLAKVAAVLRADGECWSETMMGVPRICQGENWLLDKEGIFWKDLGPEIRYERGLEVDGIRLSPIRRIHLMLDSLNREFVGSGLTVLDQEVVPPVEETNVCLVRTRMRKSGRKPL